MELAARTQSLGDIDFAVRSGSNFPRVSLRPFAEQCAASVLGEQSGGPMVTARLVSYWCFEILASQRELYSCPLPSSAENMARPLR